MNSSPYVSDSAVLQNLGARLAARRLELNLTQAQLADEAGVSKRTIERLESGATATQLSAFLRVCRVLGLQERLDQLVPEPAPSPVAQLKLRGRTRRRASGQAAGEHEGVGEPNPERGPKRWTWAP